MARPRCAAAWAFYLPPAPRPHLRSIHHTCRPWSRRALIRRVSTYTLTQWFGHSLALSPLVCARYGWVCVETDLIACDVCHKRLHLPTPSTPLQDEQSVALLSSAHDRLCPWRDNPSSEGLIEPKPLSWKEVKRKVEALSNHLARTPTIIGAEALGEVLESSGVERVLGALVCSGWRRGSSPGSLSCSTCQRMIHVDSFLLLGETGSASEVRDESERPDKRARAAAALHVLNEHRVFCPYHRADALSVQCDALKAEHEAAARAIELGTIEKETLREADTHGTEEERAERAELEASIARLRGSLLGQLSNVVTEPAALEGDHETDQ